MKQVREIMEPVGRMDGDRLPVSAFVAHVDGQFEQGAAAFEKRGVAVSVPAWDAETCIQCNNCAFVCPHATIRPFALTADEAAAAPAGMKLVPRQGQGSGAAISTRWPSLRSTAWAAACASGSAPTDSLTMVPAEGELAEQEAFDYCVAHVADKPELADTSVKGSQFKRPLLEFSGACAGCAETSYAKLVTQLFGDRMYITNATGCSSIWGGPRRHVAVHGEQPKATALRGPTRCSRTTPNMAMACRSATRRCARASRACWKTWRLATRPRPKLKALIAAWLGDGRGRAPPTPRPSDALVPALERRPQSDGCPVAPEILANKEYLAKKSVWIFGGDGWAYDIGYGGLDHVLASGQDVNVFVFDTEVYSNTGGQASKASNIGQVAQFAAAGKDIKKKSLTEIAMSYGYVYVAQVAMGAKPAQTIKAIAEAEAYPGPSLIIGYSPCEMHSIKGGMANCQDEMKKAVDCGYWNLFRFNPAAPAGKKFVLDSKEPAGGYQEFLMNEARYSRLTREFPERAGELFERNELEAMKRYEHLLKLKEVYAEA